MKKVYFISGIGADQRVFSFLDLSFCEPVFIDWIAPLKNESLESYALRLRNEIPDSHPTVVGVSFGGMLAAEMAKTDGEIKAILISSNKIASEFPGYLRMGKYLPLYKWLPARVMKGSAFGFRWISGSKTKEKDKILWNIIRDTDMRFVKWAIHAILTWKNKEIPGNIIQIHGTADKLLPFRFVSADYVIKGGSHAMPMYHNEEISALLRKLILPVS